MTYHFGLLAQCWTFIYILAISFHICIPTLYTYAVFLATFLAFDFRYFGPLTLFVFHISAFTTLTKNIPVLLSK